MSFHDIYNKSCPTKVSHISLKWVYLDNTFFGPKIWDIVPSELKQLETANSFKRGIKKWKPVNCFCGLWKPYIQNVGF